MALGRVLLYVVWTLNGVLSCGISVPSDHVTKVVSCTDVTDHMIGDIEARAIQRVLRELWMFCHALPISSWPLEVLICGIMRYVSTAGLEELFSFVRYVNFWIWRALSATGPPSLVLLRFHLIYWFHLLLSCVTSCPSSKWSENVWQSLECASSIIWSAVVLDVGGR